jgi:hypothetical protein
MYSLSQAKEECKGTQKWSQCHIMHSIFQSNLIFSQSKENILCRHILPKIAWKSTLSSHFKKTYFLSCSSGWQVFETLETSWGCVQIRHYIDFAKCPPTNTLTLIRWSPQD